MRRTKLDEVFSISQKRQKMQILRSGAPRLEDFSEKLTKCRLPGDGIFFDFYGRRNEKYK